MKLTYQRGRCIFIYIFSIIVLQPISCSSNSMFQLVYANVKPYIYYDNTTQTETGIIPEIFEFNELFCHKELKNYGNYSKIFEFTAEMDSISAINNLLISDTRYGEGMLQNVSQERAFWFPILKIIDFKSYKKVLLHNLTLVHIKNLSELVVITSEKRIHLIEKVYVGITHCASIAILAFVGGVAFALIIWGIERFNGGDFSPYFLRGFGTGTWLAFVTMGTVGYGDITPKTCPGRVIAFFWMIISVVFTSVMTATISETVHGISSLELYHQKVTALRDSPEDSVARNDYEAEVYPANSIKDMVDLLGNHTVKFGLLNADMASYYQNEFYNANLGDDRLEQLIYIYTVPVHLPLEFLVNMQNPVIDKYMKCFEKHRAEIVPSILAKYKKHLKLETLHYVSASKLIKQYPLLGYVSATLMALLLIGVFYDAHLWCNTSKSFKGTKYRDM